MPASASDEDAVNCTFDPTDALRFPYEFLDASGSTITHGFPVAVPGFAEPVCVFNATTCATDTLARVQLTCCGPTAQVDSDATVWWVVALFFWGPFILLQFWTGWKRRRRRAQLYELGIEVRSKTAAEIEAEIEADTPKPMNKLFTESGGSHYHPALKLVVGLAVVGVVVATVFEVRG